MLLRAVLPQAAKETDKAQLLAHEILMQVLGVEHTVRMINPVARLARHLLVVQLVAHQATADAAHSVFPVLVLIFDRT